MVEHPSRVNAYRLTIVTLSLLTLLTTLVLNKPSTMGPAWAIPLLLVLAGVAECWPLKLPRYGKLSLADPLCYAAMVLYGPMVTIAAAVTGGLSRFRREWKRRRTTPGFVAYSLAQTVLTYGLGACLYTTCAGRTLLDPNWTTSAYNLLVLAGAVVVTFLLNGVIVAVYQWLEQDRVGRWSSRMNWSRLRLSLQAMAPLGVLLAATVQLNPLGTLLLLGPLVVTYLSIRRYTETLRESREVIECLAEAVEKREPHTLGHAHRVARYAARIARQMGIAEGTVARVATAGRLHDLGKISVEDSVLHKEGTLDSSDLEKIRRHPEVGAQVAARLSLSREEAEYIRHHHEWFNGGGYPHGLEGDAIPLGARILAVAEAFDTLLTNRPYRSAIPQAAALNKLRAAVGSQFDPAVVDALSKSLSQRSRLRRADS